MKCLIPKEGAVEQRLFSADLKTSFLVCTAQEVSSVRLTSFRQSDNGVQGGGVVSCYGLGCSILRSTATVALLGAGLPSSLIPK